MPQTPDSPGVYVQEIPSGARIIRGAPTATTAFIGPAATGPFDEAVAIDSFGAFENTFGGLHTQHMLGHAIRHYFLNGGQQAVVVRIGDAGATRESWYAQIAEPELREKKRGLWSLDGAAFGLLCIPPFSTQTAVELPIWQAALAYCQRREAFLLLDPPHPDIAWRKAQEVQDAHRQGRGLFQIMGSHAALYYPWIMMPDPLNADRPQAFAPCGAVAGVIARTDARDGVWKAPAGMEATIEGDAVPALNLQEAETALLSAMAVNCIRMFGRHGCLIWGARTRAGASPHSSEWSYVPVRRLGSYIEKSVRDGLGWVVFEPNDAPLWAAIRDSTENFLSGLFRQGAFQGPSAKTAYFVRCDASTMTQSDIEKGLVKLVIGFAPLKPAEFILIKMQLRAQQ